GAQGVPPLQMAAAFSTLANFGSRVEPYLIQRITAADGTVLYEHTTEPRQVLSDQIAAAVVGAMKKVVSNGTARRADIGRPQAGKTGTATDSADVWFVGFIPQMTTSVWVGYADTNNPLEDFTVWNDLTGEEQYYRRAYGGTLAAPIWKQFMTYATKDMAVRDFPDDPPGASVYRQTPYATVPQLRPSTNETIDALYAVGLAGAIEEVPSTLPQGTLIGIIPGPGIKLRQGSTITVEVSSGIPPEIAMVDLRGLTRGEASESLRNFRDLVGFEITWSFVDIIVSNPASYDLVVSTSPLPGAPVGPSDTIEIRIGKAP
ncbi:Multimodular transpeptidase-transglycosylase, partial [hydrothermal vent metagenome]